MLLQKLREYSGRLNLPPKLYNELPVRYVVELDGKGQLLTPHLTDLADPSSPRTKRGQRRLVPDIQRSSGVRPLLLADKADYVFAYANEGGKSKRVADCHKAFVDLLRRCAEATGELSVSAVLRFLEDDPLSQIVLDADFSPSDRITFRVDGRFPVDLPSVQRFWAKMNEQAADADGATLMQCLICGENRPVLDRLQGKIKGVPGGQTSGTTIIGMNAPAFESYGLIASLNAPTCGECGELFTKAANSLLASETGRLIIGGVAFIFWTREDVGFDVSNLLDVRDETAVRNFLDSVRRGRRTVELDDTRFYATALSGSGGRAVVRDWIDTTLNDAQRHLAAWFQRHMLVGEWGEEPRPISLYWLARATVREAKDLSPNTPRALLRTAFAGSPAPPSLLYQAVKRNRAEQGVTYERAALIKLVLLGQRPENRKEDYMVELEQKETSPAYLCGRLLAVMEDAQRLAVGATGVGATFGTASMAPASIYPRLLRGVKYHLAKLERDNRGAQIRLQRRMEEITAGIERFPRILTIDEQGLFALGYYHERAFDRANAKEAKEAKGRRLTGTLAVSDDGNESEEEN